jgi:hypothetical protein
MNLNFQINNEEDILYLRNIDESKLEDLLRTTISIGLKSIQMSEVNMNCHSYIDPIKDIMEKSTNFQNGKILEIDDKLNDLLHIKSNSSRKGQLSEDLCRSLLNKQYPQWSFMDVSQEGYNADCRAYETPVGQILYEFKSYDYNVNRDQITKFIRDLEHTNIKYGIFVSNTSGIVGKKNIEWEIINDKLVVFISNMGLSGYGCILGTELLLSLIEINILDKDNNWLLYQNYELEDLLSNISCNIDSLRNNIESYTKHRELINEQRIKINSSIDILERSSFNCLLELNETYESIIKNIENIRCNKECIKDEFDKEDFLEKLGEGGEKNKKLFEKLLKMTGNLHVLTKEKELIFIKDKEIICFSKTLKSRLEIVFPIRGESVHFNPQYEKIRGSEIFIELKDNLEIWKIIERRTNEV